jgi:glutaredoxin
MNCDIILYALSTCSHCKAAKNFFSDNGYEYTSIDVDLLQGKEKKEAINDVKKHNPKVTFPTIVIGEKIFVGFKKSEIKEYIATRISQTPP